MPASAGNNVRKIDERVKIKIRNIYPEVWRVVHSKEAEFGGLPVGVCQMARVVAGDSAQVVASYLVQRSVVHKSKHFSVRRFSVRAHNVQGPLFSLARNQGVAEYAPLESQSVVRTRLCDNV